MEGHLEADALRLVSPGPAFLRKRAAVTGTAVVTEARQGVVNTLGQTDIEAVLHEDLLGDDVWHYSLTHRPTATRGFGTGRTRRDALVRALGELVERSAYAASEVSRFATSSGIAAHSSVEMASNAACLELIERDILITTWLARAAPVWLNVSEFSEFTRHGLRLDVGVAGVSGAVKCVVGALRPAAGSSLPFGFVLAASADKALEVAIEKVVLDSRRAATMLLCRARDGGHLFRPVPAAGLISGQDHLEYYLDPGNGDDIDWFWRGRTEPATLPELAVWTERIAPGPIDFPPTVVVRARADGAQELFFGPTEPQGIAQGRLEHLLPDGPANLKPHPLA